MELTLERLQNFLAPRPIKYFPQIGSTQDIALDWLRHNATAGSVVIADEQLVGRGRQGRTWYTPPGVALAVSVILRPEVESLSQITMLGGVAVAEMLEELGAEDVTIKWPNDVCLNGRKVSGVLPEAVWESDNLRGVALGVGINVRVDFAGHEFKQKATSLEYEMDARFDRAELIAILLARMDYWLAYLGSIELFGAWKSRLGMIGKYVTVTDDSATIHGIAQAVDTQGALILCDMHNTIHRVVAGDVLITGDQESN